MIDTRHPLCKNELCTRQPSFGIEVRYEQADAVVIARLL